MVNYIRANESTPEQVLQLTACPWDDEKYLKPVDHSRIEWLTFDYEEKYNSSTAKSANKDTSMKQISQVELNEILIKTRNLEAEVSHLNSLLDDLRTEFKNNSEKLLSELEKDTASPAETPKNCVAAVKVSEDNLYFQSYAHYEIHAEMLNVRTCEFISPLRRP